MKRVWRIVILVFVIILVGVSIPWTMDPNSIGVSDIRLNGLPFASNHQQGTKLTLRLDTSSSFGKYRGFDVSCVDGQYQISVKYNMFFGKNWGDGTTVGVPVTINIDQPIERIVLTDGKNEREVYPLSYSSTNHAIYFLSQYLSFDDRLEDHLYDKQIEKSLIWIDDSFKANHEDNYQDYLLMLKNSGIKEVKVKDFSFEFLPAYLNEDAFYVFVEIEDQLNHISYVKVKMKLVNHEHWSIHECLVEGIL